MCPAISKIINANYYRFFETEHVSNHGNILKEEGL
jgi:hypothetical protein